MYIITESQLMHLYSFDSLERADILRRVKEQPAHLHIGLLTAMCERAENDPEFKRLLFSDPFLHAFYHGLQRYGDDKFVINGLLQLIKSRQDLTEQLEKIMMMTAIPIVKPVEGRG